MADNQGFKYSWANDFLEAFKQSGNVTKSANKVGITRYKVYQAIQVDSKLKAAYDDIKSLYWVPTEAKPTITKSMKKSVLTEEKNQRLAVERLLDMLKNGVTQTIIKKETRTDRNGDVIMETITETAIKKPTPQWVISRYISPIDTDVLLLQTMADKHLITPTTADDIANRYQQFTRDLIELLKSENNNQQLRESLPNLFGCELSEADMTISQDDMTLATNDITKLWDI